MVMRTLLVSSLLLSSVAVQQALMDDKQDPSIQLGKLEHQSSSESRHFPGVTNERVHMIVFPEACHPNTHINLAC